MMSNYRIRVVSDSEHPHYLAKATWEDPNLNTSGFEYESGPPKVKDILVVEGGVYVINDRGHEQYIPATALEAVLKVGGWKAERPQ